MAVVWLIAGCLFLAACVRYLALRFSRQAVRADQWFWRMYCETVRRDRRFPPQLPQYMLDAEQWYPPLFPLLWSSLSSRFALVAERWGALTIDLARGLVLLSVTSVLTGANLRSVLAAGLVYALSPILVSYNNQLNPRGLGALWLDLVILIMIAGYAPTPWVWLAVAFLCGLVLLTHKMSTQLLWFLGLALGALQNPRFFLVIPISVLSALLLSGGFYQKVARAHWDIVTFWRRNWPWLQAHPIRESPIYGEPGYQSPTKFYQRGPKGFLRHVRYMAAYAPAAWALVFLLLLRGHPFESGARVVEAVLWWWGLVLLFAICTVFVRPLRCLGSGYLYLYNAAFPTALLWGLAWNTSGYHWAIATVFAGSLAASALALVTYYRQSSSQSREGTDLDQALAFLKMQPRGVVMCLPPQLYDVVAYQTAHPVLFGGHGYGFKLLEPTFPRLLVPVSELLTRYQIRYVLCRTDYVPSSFAVMMSKPRETAFGRYVIWVLSHPQDARASQPAALAVQH